MPSYEENTIDDFLRKLIESGGQEGPIEPQASGLRIPSDPDYSPSPILDPREPAKAPSFTLEPSDLTALPANRIAPGTTQSAGWPYPPPLASEAKGGPVPFDYGAFNKSSVMGEATPPLFPRSGETFDGRTPISEFGQLFPYKGQLSQDEVAGYMKKIQERNVGSSPVPSVDTSKPIIEPPSLQPTPANPVTGAPVAQPTQSAEEPTSPVAPTTPYDPNNLLLEQYRPAIMDLAMEARKRDLARMDNPITASQAHHLLAVGISTGDATLQSEGAKLLRDSQFGPLYQPSLKAAGESAQQLGAGQKISEAMDANSPTSEAHRIAAMASPMMDDWANRATENGEFQNPTQAKAWMYRKLKGLHGAAISGYLDTIVKGGDFSKTAAERQLTNVLSDKNSWEAKQIRLAFETDAALKAALSDANHPASIAVKRELRNLDRQTYDSIPNVEKMNGLEAGAAMGLMNPALQVLQRRVEMQHEVEKKKDIVPGVLRFRTRRVNNGLMDVDVLPADADANAEKTRLGNTQAALQLALDVRAEADRLALLGASTTLGSRGRELGSRLRQLNEAMSAIGATDKNKDFDYLYQVLEKGDVPVSSVTGNINGLLDAAFTSINTRAGVNAPRIERLDIEHAASQKADTPLPMGPALGYEKNHEKVSPVSVVMVKDPYNNGTPTWANKQNIGGQFHYWLKSGKEVILNPSLRPEDDPSKFEVPVPKRTK